MRNRVASYAHRFFFVVLLAFSGWFSTDAFAYSTHTLTQGQWSLISVPADPGPDGSVTTLFGDDLPLDQYGSSGRWVLYSYDPSSGEYLEVPVDEPLAANTGYWMIQLVSETVELDIPDTLNPLTGSDIPGCAEEQCAARPLVSSGESVTWNLVGYSSELAATYGETSFVTPDGSCAGGCSPSEAQAADVAYNVMFRYNPENTESPYEVVDEDTVMSPWDGYWLAAGAGSTSPQWLLPTVLAPEMPEPGMPAITSPEAGSQLSGSEVLVSWGANGLDTERWRVRAGPTRKSIAYGNYIINDGTINQVTIAGLPVDGSSRVFVRLAYWQDNQWVTSDVQQYLAFDGEAPDPDDPENSAPVAGDDSVGPVTAGDSITINVLANDMDEDGEIVAITLVDQPSSGTAVIGDDGQITYTHDGSDSESDSLTYTVQDDDDAVSNVATVTISPIEPADPTDPENMAPVAGDDSVGPVTAGDSIIINVLANDMDEDGEIAAITIVEQPVYGTAVIGDDGQITYTHDGSDSESDSLTYTVQDDDDAVSNVATVTISPIEPADPTDPENVAPVAGDDSVGPVTAGGSITINVLANDMDEDGEIAAITIVEQPVYGTAVIGDDGLITYTHDGSNSESDSLTYTVQDDDDAVSNVATVTISPIEPAESENMAPVAADDSGGPVTAGGSIVINVLANDMDEDGEIVAITIVDQPSSGTVAVGDDGQITYTHDGSDSESDSLTYTVQDDDDAVSNVATVTISPIEPAESENIAPVAVDDDGGSITAGDSITINVLANDMDEDGEIVSVTIVDQPSAGTAVVGEDGQITYTHDGSEGTESDSLTYTVLDDDDAVSNVATVTIAPIADDRGTDPNVTAEQRDAARLLMQASFGPSDEAIDEVIAAGGPQAWVDAQLQLPATRHLPMVKNLFPDQSDEQTGRYQAFWNRAISADDQLRQRVAFALSHIMVVSDKPDAIGSHGNMVAAYYDVLVRNAFGNFRDLMDEVTRSPAMGVFLSMLGNDKPDPETGSRADENYARELMQLFSIGLVGLNLDGTEIPNSVTYTQADVENLARVFTGWAWDLDRYKGWTSGWQPDRAAMERPMVAFQERHDTEAKTFLGLNIPAGQTAEADMQMALDRIFSHPNVGPFISKQLIKRLVTSNPSPAYVRRVATVFNDNGNGVRGDLGSVVRAILIDTEARSESVANGQNFGKLRESLLRYAHTWRAFRMTDPITIDYSLQQHLPQIAPLTAPSVFNFFRPNYAPPGTFTNAGLVGPEFQLNSETRVNNVNRALMRVALEDVFHNTPTRLNLNRERQLLSDPEALMSHLNRILFAGQLLDGSRNLLIEYIETNRGEIEDDRLIRDVIGLAITSTDFAVQR